MTDLYQIWQIEFLYILEKLLQIVSDFSFFFVDFY